MKAIIRMREFTSYRWFSTQTDPGNKGVLLHQFVMPEQVQACYVEMNGKEYYLDDTTDEGIVECTGPVD